VAEWLALAAGKNSADDRSGFLYRCRTSEDSDFHQRDYRSRDHDLDTPVADYHRGSVLELVVLAPEVPAPGPADDMNPLDAAAAPAAASWEAGRTGDSARSTQARVESR
jgi:hypothetical protein